MELLFWCGAIAVAALFAAVVIFLLFMSGEIVGSVSSLVSTPLLSDRTLRLVVKRIAPSGSRRQPIVTLHARSFGGATMGRLNAIQAKGMADAIDGMVGGKTPNVKQFGEYTLELIPGREIGIHMTIGDMDKTARLDYADAHELAKLLRTAAAT